MDTTTDLSLKDRALAAYREHSEASRLAQEKTEQESRDRKESELREYLETTLGIKGGLHFKHSGEFEYAYATHDELPGVRFYVHRIVGYTARQLMAETDFTIPEGFEYVDWFENSENHPTPPGSCRIASWSDLGWLLMRIDDYGPIEIKPWPPKMSSPANEAPAVELPSSLTRVACLLIPEANFESRPYRIVAGVTLENSTPAVIVEYTDL